MRIGLLSHEYPPFVGGGIGSYTAAAARHLAAAGHEVHVVTNAATFGATAPELTAPRWQDGNLVIHRLPLFDEEYRVANGERCFGEDPTAFAWHTREVVRDPSHVAAIRIADYVATLHRERPLDVVEAPDCMAEAFYLIRRRRAGADLPPVCVHAHGTSREVYVTAEDPQRLGTLCIRGRMAREDACLQHADALLAPSSGILRQYDAWYRGALPSTRAVIPYYFDAPVGGALPAGLESGPFLLLVGRVEPRKGSDLALRAFAQLAAEFPTLRLVFCGDATAWRYGESFAALLDNTLDAAARRRVVCLGSQPRDAVFAAMARAAVFLHPARWDNWPNVVVEAMAAGAPCVVSDAGGQAEMVQHERSGLVTPAGDPVALENAVRRVLRDELDVAAMRQSARQRVAEFTAPATLTEARLRLFDEVVAAARRPERVALTSAAGPPALPGEGLVLIDADSAPEDATARSLAILAPIVRAAAGWRGTLLSSSTPCSALHCAEFPHRWFTDPPPWLGTGADTTIVYVKGGACPEPTAVRALANLVHGSVPPHGAFLWLRAGKAGSCFPYRPDTGWRDLLLRGGNLPAMFAVRAAWLGSARTFVGLSSPEARIAGLAALAARASGRRLLHTGEVGGTYQGTQLMLWEDAQQRALGFLDLCDALPRGGVFFGEVGLANWRLVQLRRGHRKWQRGEEGQRHARLVASDGAANHEVTDV